MTLDKYNTVSLPCVNYIYDRVIMVRNDNKNGKGIMKIVQISFLRHSSTQFCSKVFWKIKKKFVVLLNIKVNVKS